MNQLKTFDVAAVRADFPILARTVHGKPLVYLDNGASAQKPRCVIESLRHTYEHEYSNVHRAAHELSNATTEKFEASRRTVQKFLNAPEDREVIFLRGTTEAVNLVSNTYGRANLKPGDEVLITAMEHHSNIVPWQMICEQTGAKLVVAPMDKTGTLILPEFQKRLSRRTRIVSCVHISNALGTINPIAEMARMAKAVGAVIMVDGAQAAPHMRIDVQALGVDFYAFSGHKAFGPTGIGALWGKAGLLENMPPWQGGGEMIEEVTFERSSYARVPHKFEAGTPHIVGAIGLGAAVDYLQALGRERVAQYERELLAYATRVIGAIPGLRIIGTAADKASIVSFVLDDVHPHDTGTILDRQGIAVRAGHHCTMPLMNRFGLSGTARASFALYNTRAEVDRLAEGIVKVQEMFAR